MRGCVGAWMHGGVERESLNIRPSVFVIGQLAITAGGVEASVLALHRCFYAEPSSAQQRAEVPIAFVKEVRDSCTVPQTCCMEHAVIGNMHTYVCCSSWV